jgi:hypothetical protein
MRRWFTVLALLAMASLASANVPIHPPPHHGGGPCACGAGNTPNICVDNPTPTAGSTVSLTLACGPANGDLFGWTSPYSGANSRLFSQHIGGASSITLPMPVPNVASDRPVYWHAYLADSGGGTVSLNGQAITVPATIPQVLGNALPADVGADPFVPAHVVTVCPSGCDYAHVEDAISFVQSINPAWDNVEITIDAADYPFPNGNAFPVNAFNFPNMPAHLWFKGIVGRSGTNGTVFPRFFDAPGDNPNTSELINTAGPTAIWFDNLEFGPFDFWCSIPNAQSNTFRNVYFQQCAQGLINSDGPHHNVTILNSHFARNGNGSGPDHNIYQGAGDNADQLIITNSVIEQVNISHDVKTRAMATTLTCVKDLINQDLSFNGSELVDCSEGRICRVHNSLLVNGGGAPGWNQNNSFDALRFGADTEFTTLPNNIVDAQGSTFISDNDASYFQFINLHRAITPFPPAVPAGNVSPNTFVFFSSDQMNAFGHGFQANGQLANADVTVSTIVTGLTDHGSNANAIDLGTIGVQNFVYSDRAAAGLPAIGTYPKGYTDPAYNAMPAACTDWVGLVKVPSGGQQAQLTISPASVAFPQTPVGGGTVQGTVATNTGPTTITIASESLISGDTSQFSLSGGNCVGTTLTPGQSCNISGTFSPTAPGSYLATGSLTDTMGNNFQ